jgi:hypothetical protein
LPKQGNTEPGKLGYKEAANLTVDAAARHCGTKEDFPLE